MLNRRSFGIFGRHPHFMQFSCCLVDVSWREGFGVWHCGSVVADQVEVKRRSMRLEIVIRSVRFAWRFYWRIDLGFEVRIGGKKVWGCFNLWRNPRRRENYCFPHCGEHFGSIINMRIVHLWRWILSVPIGRSCHRLQVLLMQGLEYSVFLTRWQRPFSRSIFVLGIKERRCWTRVR